MQSEKQLEVWEDDGGAPESLRAPREPLAIKRQYPLPNRGATEEQTRQYSQPYMKSAVIITARK